MVVDALAPAVAVDESVDGRQPTSQLLLPLGVDEAADPPDVVDGDDTGGGGGWGGQQVRGELYTT